MTVKAVKSTQMLLIEKLGLHIHRSSPPSPIQIKAVIPQDSHSSKTLHIYTVVINKVWTMFAETLKNQVKNIVWIQVLLNKPIMRVLSN